MTNIERLIIYGILAFLSGGDLAELFRLSDIELKVDKIISILEKHNE